MDVNVRRAVTDGLRLRGAKVLTAQEDGARELADDALLDRATELGYVLFTQETTSSVKLHSAKNVAQHLLASSMRISSR